MTRSGTNTFDSSIYHYYRSPKLNTNYYFNKRQQPRRRTTSSCTSTAAAWAARSCCPGFDGRGKAFFFFNFEHQYQPSNQTRTRTILRDEAQNGIFSYNVTAGGVTTRRPST